MDSIAVRYGEDVTLPLDTGDTTAVYADIYIGKPGQVYTLTKHIELANGVGTFVFTGTEMEIAPDTYNYQINVTDNLGAVEKYPSPTPNCEDCSVEFPTFTVCEALDEVVS